MNHQRIKYLDDLRVIGIFAIILVHVASLWVTSTIVGVDWQKLASTIGNIGVPIFLMISGALLLNKNYPTVSGFYKKRFPRITIPFIFWIIIYGIYSLHTTGISNLSYDIANTFLNNLGWYFYLIVGVYLAIPFINEFIRNRGLNEVRYFIIIFILASVFYTACRFFNITSYLDLRFFIGGLSYVIVGYYLANVKIKSPKKVMAGTVLLFLISLFVSYQMPEIGVYEFNNPNLYLNSYLDFSIFRLGLGASVFLFVRCLFLNTATTTEKLTLSISKASYGMYLSHITLFLFIRNHLSIFTAGASGFGIVIRLVLMTIGVFLITWIVTVILSKIPYLKEFSGYH